MKAWKRLSRKEKAVFKISLLAIHVGLETVSFIYDGQDVGKIATAVLLGEFSVGTVTGLFMEIQNICNSEISEDNKQAIIAKIQEDKDLSKMEKGGISDSD